MTSQLTIAKVNNVPIIVINNGEKRVAIKPICEALGVDFSSQLQKIKSDPILSSTVGMITTVGGDKKDRDMQTIPLKYVFGWLFRIDSRNVKEDVRENILKYQMECYDALYNHFTSYADFVEQRQKAVDAQFEIYDLAKQSYSQANKVMKDAETELKKMRKLTFENYDAERRQLKLFSEDE